MKALIVCDDKGHILSISKLEDVGAAPSGIVDTGVVVEDGCAAHYIDLPDRLAELPIIELHERYRFRGGKRPGLVRARD